MDEQPTQGGLVPHEQARGPVVPRQAESMYDPELHGGAMWATFDSATEHGLMMALDMRYGNAKAFSDVVNRELEVSDAMIVPVPVTAPDTGEVTTRPRIVLRCTDGTNVACVSGGVFSCLAMIVKARGGKTWSPPVRVMPIAKQLPGGKRWHGLLYVASPAPQPQAKKGGK